MVETSSETNGGGGEEKAKTATQLKKEAAKAEKLAKFQEKQKKIGGQAAAQATTKEKPKPAEKKPQDVADYSAATKEGDMKDISNSMPDTYSPKYVEAAWYAWWEKEGMFKPEYNRDLREENPKGQFTIVIPPPNVTGTLHLGHALATTIEDTMTRWHRMKGKTVLFNPGCDHAGIATQVVVEKRLQRLHGLSRHDLGRERFVQEVWKWKHEKGGVIYDQLRRMGASVDWDRAVFMMDPKLMRSVTQAFITLHERGVIYRSTRLVNWSCALRSAISDIEVDKKELTGRTMLSVPGYKDKVEFGTLISFAYPIEGTDEEVVVSTTRVETMLGDTAIAVHPSDDRYEHLKGKLCLHPFIEGRKLPIIADAFVDREFGTGAVKITPAHDHNDYEVGMRHALPFITCITDDGLIAEGCGPFTGRPRFEARRLLIEALKSKGLYRDCQDNPMIVPICSRSNDVIEPILKAQWYVRSDEMAQRAIDVVASGELRIFPDFHIPTWNRWMQGIRDWCISRQLWWGHRIPAYFISSNDSSIPPGDTANDRYWVSAHTEAEALEKAAKRFNIAKEKIILEWDEDVLDTWFSSALWPFAIFGWPEKTFDLSKFFPGQLLETGHDILFFWVARMVFMAQELTGKLPFRDVYLHPVVRDAHGRKMSKSLGNVIDPLDVIRGISLADLHQQLETGNLDPKELIIAKQGQARDYPQGIPECGTDAMRFALLAYTGQAGARDINLDVLRVQGYRFFCNKIWQAVRFTMVQLGDGFRAPKKFKANGSESRLDRWILSRLADAVTICNDSMATYGFQQTTTAIYNFWLYELCDIYLEGIKPIMNKGDDKAKETTRMVLHACVDTGLRMAAPMMPFIVEELWQRLPHARGMCAERIPLSVHIADYPEPEQYPYHDASLDNEMSFALDIVKTVRSLRSDYGLTGKNKADLYLTDCSKEDGDQLQHYTALIGTLASSNKVQLLGHSENATIPDGCAQMAVGGRCKIHLALQGVIDPVKELQKLDNRRGQLLKSVTRFTEMETQSDYEHKVPLGVRSDNAAKKSNLQLELQHLEEAIAALNQKK